jgi:hypothetical protein
MPGRLRDRAAPSTLIFDWAAFYHHQNDSRRSGRYDYPTSVDADTGRGVEVNIRSLFSKWPELLAVVSLLLIGIFVWDRFFRVKHPVVHMSCFAYRDVNRNGIYDVGDRPYAGLKVMIDRPRGRRVEQESNMAGFANFDMSLGSRNAELNRPGEYIVRVQPPRDWDVTSSNQTQRLTLQQRDRSAVGLIATRTIDAVGVAPRLQISGTIVASTNSGNTILKAKGPEGRESVVPILDGAYLLPASPGLWTLECAAGNDISNGSSVVRNLSVEKYPVVVSRMTPDRLSFAAKAKLKIVGFDNLTTSDTLLEIPNGYEGLNWRNWVATHQKFYDGNAFVNGTTSGEYFAYTSSGHPATISSSNMFDFVGACVGVAWKGGEEHDVVVKAWRNESEVYHDRFRARTAGPIYFDADYRSITRVEIASEGYWQILVDDVALRTE